MPLDQVPAPDLGALAVGNPTLQYLEGLGFSRDARLLLVRATFTDDADANVQLHQGMWLYDVASRRYASCVNLVLASALDTEASGFDIREASLAGDASSPTVVAQVVSRDSPDVSVLSLIRADGSVTPDLLAALTGEAVNPWIDRQSLSPDGRFLAIQTTDPAMSPPTQMDTNDSSDIHLVDLLTGKVARVSWIGGAEVDAPVLLGNVRSENGRVFVGFATQAAFDRNDRNAQDTTPDAATDAYLWSCAYDANGLIGAGVFALESVSTRGLASGHVGPDAPVLASATGTLFESAGGDLIAQDGNAASDVFIRPEGAPARRLTLQGVGELSSGAALVSASDSGRIALLLTDSIEIAGPVGVRQLVAVTSDTGAWNLVSRAAAPADDVITSATISLSGSMVAFTTLAGNLAAEPRTSSGGSLFVVASGFDIRSGTAGDDPALTGGAGNETLEGLAGNDTLTGLAGDDRLDGGNGLDTAVFTGALSGYAVSRTGTTITVADLTPARDGTDTGMNLERLQFTDMAVNLTVQATAASIPQPALDRICELYVGFFGRVPAANGLENWVNQYKGGKTLDLIAGDFYGIGSSPDLRGYTGYWDFAANRELTDQDFIRIVYRNVLARDGLTEGIDYWAGQLSGVGAKTRGELVSTMLDAAHGLKPNADWGWVADLLDDRITMSKRVAMEWGLNYASTAQQAIETGMAIAGALNVSPNPNPVYSRIPIKTFDFDEAVAVVGVNPENIDLLP